MRRTRRTFWWLVAGPVVVLLAICVEAYPFLAITRPSGSKVLVVEGWLDPAPMDAAARLAIDSSYTQIYTTGTIRSFAYYLSGDEGIATELRESASGNLRIEVAGNTGSRFILVADGDTLLNAAVLADVRPYHVQLAVPVKNILVKALDAVGPAGSPVIFIRSFLIGGMNVHGLQQDMQFIRPDGTRTPCSPTYAQSARASLITRGVPSDRITAVPAYGYPRSRSWGNAHAFAIEARTDGITAFDIATSGVHARRSRDLFQTACGPDVHVGVISLPDPHCTKANWWKSIRGWFTMIKEVVGAPEAQAVEATR